MRVYEKAQRDRTGMETLSKLKGVIMTGETSGDLRTRRNELYRLMRELQERKKLQQLLSKTGSAIRGAKAVAKELWTIGIKCPPQREPQKKNVWPI